MRFKFCPNCGEKLTTKPMGDEGEVPFCKKCDKAWFDMFSNAVIVLVINEYGEAAVLRQNYISERFFNLVSGYMKPGETAENAARREVSEEIGVEITDLSLVGTFWFAKKDMLMTGFISCAKKTDFTLSTEVDGAEWIPAEDAINRVHPKGSVSYALLDEYLKRNLRKGEINEN